MYVKEYAMTQRFCIYFKENGICKKFEKEPNKTELINQLLTDYYNRDLDYLEGEQQILTEKLTINKIRIDNIKAKREQIKKLDDEKLKREREITEGKELVNSVQRLWVDKTITDKEYWSLFDGGKLNKRKAIKVLKRVFNGK